MSEMNLNELPIKEISQHGLSLQDMVDYFNNMVGVVNLREVMYHDGEKGPYFTYPDPPTRCSMCEEVIEGKPPFANLVKEFCSSDCANAYLESEGFTHRVSSC